MLNKVILDVVVKYLEGDNFRCQGKFLIMGIEVCFFVIVLFLLRKKIYLFNIVNKQVSKWCVKYLKMIFMLIGDF